MAKKRVSSVDMDTGEILDYSLVAMQHKIPNGFAGGVGSNGTGRDGNAGSKRLTG